MRADDDAPDDERHRPALAQLLAGQFLHEGVDPGYLQFVLQHLRRPDAQWRWCCDSNCDPCVKQLGRLVDLARRHLGIAAPREPGPGPQ
ncbi:MAG: hypothetical protein AB7O97_09065 [Planctomycetota bacterium]